MNINALKQYKSVDLRASIESATPHHLITMLLGGAQEALAKAAGAIERKDIGLRTLQLNKATDIVMNLKGTLNHEAGGELSANLDRLYDYMVRCLYEANRDNDESKVREVRGLLSQIAEGWSQIAVSEHHTTSVPAV
ncbi:flagellar export chaperone FliS [Marinobacterium rhizophilum]|uniref:Flagellar secretion chaperone FliS n=1 Tax=Marinobacterium rhizophilum TaxID=420402 RepID=A0ABY5HDV6_9GAMM|nr:flagellar export chaperone FliS [Marinobacterium rhizophilum]UTW10046.1 flagellar export chaperone FliS [Marinobacterium rhizophilum]